MNFAIGILASIVVVQAGAVPLYSYYHPAAVTSLVRAPQHDTAIVSSDRSGGNFAYSIAESRAYQAFAPDASYDHDYHEPFGYSHHHHHHRPHGSFTPGHHFYVQHPVYHTTTFVPIVYPSHPSEHPSEDEPSESGKPEKADLEKPNPEEPIKIAKPDEPIELAKPEKPIELATPEKPIELATPEEPIELATPEEPTENGDSVVVNGYINDQNDGNIAETTDDYSEDDSEVDIEDNSGNLNGDDDNEDDVTDDSITVDAYRFSNP